MEQTIHQITFSPTGGTRRVSELLCAGFKAQSTLTELCITEDKLKYPSIAADDLVVIENGRVMETGTHDELYANHGKYYEIFNAMSDSLNLDKISQTLNS